MESTEIKIRDVVFTVEYDYTKGDFGDWETPPSHPRVDIIHIYIADVSVYNVLCQNVIEEIENAIFDQYE